MNSNRIDNRIEIDIKSGTMHCPSIIAINCLIAETDWCHFFPFKSNSIQFNSIKQHKTEAIHHKQFDLGPPKEVYCYFTLTLNHSSSSLKSSNNKKQFQFNFNHWKQLNHNKL